MKKILSIDGKGTLLASEQYFHIHMKQSLEVIARKCQLSWMRVTKTKQQQNTQLKLKTYPITTTRC